MIIVGDITDSNRTQAASTIQIRDTHFMHDMDDGGVENGSTEFNINECTALRREPRHRMAGEDRSGIAPRCNAASEQRNHQSGRTGDKCNTNGDREARRQGLIIAGISSALFEPEKSDR